MRYWGERTALNTSTGRVPWPRASTPCFVCNANVLPTLRETGPFICCLCWAARINHVLAERHGHQVVITDLVRDVEWSRVRRSWLQRRSGDDDQVSVAAG